MRGSPKAVFEAYQVLCTRSSELGLEVNANKCELISTGGVSKEDLFFFFFFFFFFFSRWSGF